MDINTRLSLLWTLFGQLYGLTLEAFRKCKNKYILQEDEDEVEDEQCDVDPLSLCKSGNTTELRKHSGYNVNEALLVSVKYNKKEAAEYLIEQGANNLDDALVLACTNNLYDISELLVKKGAKIVCGLRVSKSPNITRMLYRYEQESENIS
jgi:hypothetical protein